MVPAGWEAWRESRTWTKPGILKVTKIKNKRTRSSALRGFKRFVRPKCWLCQDEQVQVRAPSQNARLLAREDIAVRIAGSCIPTKHQSGSRTSSNPRKLERAAKRSPLHKDVAKKKDHTKVGSFRLARSTGARCIRRRIVGRSIRSCGRKLRPRGGSVSDRTEEGAGNAGKPRRLTGLVGIWAPYRRLYAPLCG